MNRTKPLSMSQASREFPVCSVEQVLGLSLRVGEFMSSPSSNDTLERRVCKHTLLCHYDLELRSMGVR